MPKVRLSYDGWLALPEAVRRKLDVATGDRLEVEFADGAVVLRPARRADTAGQDMPEPEPAVAEQLVEVVPEPASVAAPPAAKRGPGRPRKVPADVALPPSPKARGRRKNAVAAEAQTG